MNKILLIVMLLSVCKASLASNPSPKTLTIGWTASPTTSVVSYNIYEVTAATNILGSVTNQLTYDIASVDLSTNHIYAISAVDTNGVESVLSVPLNVSIPLPPTQARIVQVK